MCKRFGEDFCLTHHCITHLLCFEKSWQSPVCCVCVQLGHGIYSMILVRMCSPSHSNFKSWCQIKTHAWNCTVLQWSAMCEQWGGSLTLCISGEERLHTYHNYTEDILVAVILRKSKTSCMKDHKCRAHLWLLDSCRRVNELVIPDGLTEGSVSTVGSGSTVGSSPSGQSSLIPIGGLHMPFPAEFFTCTYYSK